MAVADYSTNPALNTSIAGIDISEGSAASGYNNALRQIMADIAAWTAAYAVTYPISVANGGTGGATAAAALANLGALADDYRELPQIGVSTGFTPTLDYSGCHVYYTGGAATMTVPANAAVAFQLGTTIVLVNNGSGALSIARAGGVGMKWSATGADADRSLAIGGMATLLKVANDLWFISGSQLT